MTNENNLDLEETELLDLRPAVVHGKRVTKRDVAILLCTMIFCSVGFTGGYYLYHTLASHHKKDHKKPAPSGYHADIVSSIQPSHIRENLKYLTSRQHIAGSAENYEEVVYMKQFYEKAGFDRVDVAEYQVLLSYPTKPAYISLKDRKQNKLLFETHPQEKVLWEDEKVRNVAFPFNGYSPAGDVKGKLVYVNYATAEDFELLAKMKISVKGRIAIARYGHIFRANKAQLAYEAGAIGLLMFTDPEGYSRGSVKYPNSWWLPEDGVQRGTVILSNGDPLTPGLPAEDGIYRLPMDKASLPKIPIQPISYGDALPLLRQMDGEKAPREWQGGLNITYRITMKDDNPNEVRLVVNTEYKTGKIHNVIATMYGETEPDRTVLFGNHHDAWVLGACDPSSGTAVMMEIGRVLGEAKQKGWRPRRTIKIAAWDAEEFGLIGSTEWLEQNTHVLSYEAVAYINTDVAVSGNFTVYARGSAQIPDVLYEAAKKIKDPDEKEKSLYETWTRKTPDSQFKDLPRVILPGSGSDHETFYSRLGIPVVDISFVYDWDQVGHISSYPTYHSIHDSFHYMETYIDKDFHYHATLGKLMVQSGLYISDTEIIPFNYSTYARILGDCKNKSMEYEKVLAQRNISMDPLKNTIEDFRLAAKRFHAEVTRMAKDDPLRVRMVNDRIMHIGRAFIAPHGLPDRPLDRHVIYAPSARNSYKGSCFPGFADVMFELLQGDKTDWSAAGEQLSLVVYHIRQATMLLEFK